MDPKGPQGKGLKVHIPKGVDDKLRKIISGSDFAALDTHTESRNTQFELRIASYFCQAGCAVDLSTGTDVIATTPKYAFYLECKRIASPNNFRQNLIKARNQLIERMPRRHDNKKTYGFIAADVTKVAFTHNGLTFGLTNDHARDVAQDKLIKIGDSTMDIPIFSNCRNLLCCLLQIHIPSLITHPPTTATRFSSYEIPTSNLDRRSRQALRIFEAIITAVGNRADAREIPPEKLIRRTTVYLPAGAIFWFDEQLLEAFSEGSDNYSKTSDEVIAGLTFDGVEHEFTLMDFEMLAADMPISERQRLASSPDSTRLELIMKMYIQRYPFENA